MNEYIFYTCEGYTYPPIEDMEVENCQVLGCAEGNNVDEAIHNLLKENPWITECGFNIEEAFCKQLLTDVQREDIERDDEIREYLIDLLDKRQLNDFKEWLVSKGW